MEESEFDDADYDNLPDAIARIKELEQLIVGNKVLSVESAADIDKSKITLILNPEKINLVAAFTELRKNRPIKIEAIDGQVISFKAIP